MSACMTESTEAGISDLGILLLPIEFHDVLLEAELKAKEYCFL